MKNSITLSFFAIFVTGCGMGSDTFRSKEHQIAGADVLALSPEVSAVIFQQKGDPVHVCMSPGAMAVQTRRSSFGLGAVLGGSDDNLQEGNAAGADVLGGLSPNVHITRELMYRTCEFVSNFDLNKNEAIELYNNVLKTISVLPVYGSGSESSADDQSDGI